MRILRITSFYDNYLESFYLKNGQDLSFADQNKFFIKDSFSWFGAWERELKSLGHEAWEIIYNAEPMQKSWAAENGCSHIDMQSICIEQARRFKPDIVWYDIKDIETLQILRDQVPSIRLILGWVGSALPNIKFLRGIDLVLSCAPESVQFLRESGAKSEHMHHAFDPMVLEYLSPGDRSIPVSFIGQILCKGDFHLIREKLLCEIAEKIGIKIFSDNISPSLFPYFYMAVKRLAFDTVFHFSKNNLLKDLLLSIPVLKDILKWPERPVLPANPKLRKCMMPPLYGTMMLQAIRNSLIGLNIHADSSPKFVSNMRLFEITGVGTCMVVEQRSNISELFVPQKEVITYGSVEECIEKISWLLDHPVERASIAQAGQKRTLQEHTFKQRAIQLEQLLRNEL